MLKYKSIILILFIYKAIMKKLSRNIYNINSNINLSKNTQGVININKNYHKKV